MKKIVAVTLILLIGFEAKTQITVGVQAGGTLSNALSEAAFFGTTQKERGNLKIGFKTGVFYNITLGKHFAAMPELNLVQKGWRDDDGLTNLRFKLLFAELPLNLAYKIDAEEGKFLIGLGPVISVGLSGKIKQESGASPITFNRDGAASGDLNLERLEMGANIFAVYSFPSGGFIKASFNKGLSDLMPGSFGRLTTSYAFVGIGFMFGGGE